MSTFRNCSLSIGAVVLLTLAASSKGDEPQLAKSIAPAKTLNEGNFEHRYFELKEGDQFDSIRGGRIRVDKVADDGIILSRPQYADRNLPEWKLPVAPLKSSMGNHEYLRLMAIDWEKRTIRLRLETKVKFSALDALSF